MISGSLPARLARISHQLTVEVRNKPAITALRLLTVVNVTALTYCTENKRLSGPVTVPVIAWRPPCHFDRLQFLRIPGGWMWGKSHRIKNLVRISCVNAIMSGT
mgnify:CR=1 FL=1